jgi:hypothetical protein
MNSSCNKPVNPLTKKQDLIHLAILLLIAFGIGVYLIVTTVVITKDGEWYIEQARRLSSNPEYVIKGQPFGFPLLIFITFKFIALLSNNSSLFTWIYTAQSVTLLCRLLSLIPLYFIGKLLVGGKRSFQAILILILLPYPAHFVSEILREWPHILFLASGLLFLFLALKHSKYWMFGAAGFLAGLGHTIRPECAQIVIYGVLWIFIRLLRPKPQINRPKLLCALLALLIGFAIPAAPYMKARGQFLPAKLKSLISSVSSEESKSRKGRLAPEIQRPEINGNNKLYSASGMPGKIAKAITELLGAMSENLMYYFFPALLIGIFCRFRKKSSITEIEMFFMPAFVVLNALMLIALYYCWGYISRRHCLPLVVFTIFYVPIGLQVFADWFANRFSHDRDGLHHKSRPASGKNCHQWFYILLITGIIICLPKLLSRPGSDKPGYRTAAAWLKQNTAQDDLIATPDRRITFYAERKAIFYENTPPGKADYIVSIVENEAQKPDFVGAEKERYSVWINKQKKKKIVIYKMLL